MNNLFMTSESTDGNKRDRERESIFLPYYLLYTVNLLNPESNLKSFRPYLILKTL